MASSIRGGESYMHRQGYYSYWYKGTLFTTLDAADVKNFWTTVFVVLNFSTVLLGAFFIKSLNLRTLSMLRTVRINHLTSWLSLTGALRYFLRTRQLPGGYCGFLMLLTGVFSLGHQYFTNSFVQRVTLQSDCPFEFGIVTTRWTNREGKGTIFPSSTWSAASTVYNAQLQATLNGGAWGIYQKVNYNFTAFSPTNKDVIGTWNCFRYPDTNISWADWQSESAVNSSLQQQMFLFTEASSFSGAIDANDGGVQGFLVWSADQPDSSNLAWKVRASVSTNLGGSSPPNSTVRTVTNLLCELASSRGTSGTLPSMPSQQSLDEWGPTTFGSLMATEPGQYAILIEWMLNAMVMVTGSENSDQWGPTDLPEGASKTYGCQVPGTKITPEFWVILGAMLLIFVPLFLADIVLLFFRIIFRYWNVDHAHLANAAPSGVEDWQLAVTIEETEVEAIKVKDMKDYFYGWDESKGKYRIIGKNPKCVQAQNSTLNIDHLAKLNPQLSSSA